MANVRPPNYTLSKPWFVFSQIFLFGGVHRPHAIYHQTYYIDTMSIDRRECLPKQWTLEVNNSNQHSNKGQDSEASHVEAGRFNFPQNGPYNGHVWCQNLPPKPVALLEAAHSRAGEGETTSGQKRNHCHDTSRLTSRRDISRCNKAISRTPAALIIDAATVGHPVPPDHYVARPGSKVVVGSSAFIFQRSFKTLI